MQQELVDKLIEASKEAAVHRVCSDACGVCELHFADCNANICSDDFPITKVYFSCAGARLRETFVKAKMLLIAGGCGHWVDEETWDRHSDVDSEGNPCIVIDDGYDEDNRLHDYREDFHSDG